jgi:4-diphosphocytidyl-2-C-methyl-D-erythritol kinase
MKILSPAKINLFLQVTAKRPDGYHELSSLMCCVNLCDTIWLHFDLKSIKIESNHPQVPLDDTNLAHRAATVFLKTLNVKDGLKIFIDKTIPVAAGLGGGSSNAASVLKGLNQHYGFPFSRKQLISMGLALGADVPFFLFGKPALASGRGEKLEAYARPLCFHIVVVNPGFKVSTGEVFQNLNLGLTNCEKKIKEPFSIKIDFDPELHLCNDLEIVTASEYPVIASMKAQLLNLGALGALMSGSGPTVFGLFSEPHAAESAKQVIVKNTCWDAFVCDLIDQRQSGGEGIHIFSSKGGN